MQYPILGHLKLQDFDFEELLISYHPSINGQDQDTVYLQWGLIYKEMTNVEHQSVIDSWRGNEMIPEHCYFRNDGIGFDLAIDQLIDCINANSNQPLWDYAFKSESYDLRNPALQQIKAEIFAAFGLDAKRSYSENLKIFRNQEIK